MAGVKQPQAPEFVFALKFHNGGIPYGIAAKTIGSLQQWLDLCPVLLRAGYYNVTLAALGQLPAVFVRNYYRVVLPNGDAVQ